MKKIFKILFFLSFLLLFSLLTHSFLAQSPTDTPEDPDLLPSYKLECLALPENIKDEKPKFPPPTLDFIVNGECSGPQGCHLAMCIISLKDRGLGAFNEFNEEFAGQNISEARAHRELLTLFRDKLLEECTTGNSQRDISYFGQDYTSALQTVNIEGITPKNTTFSSSQLTDNFIPKGKVTNLPVSLNNPNNHVYYAFYAVSSTGDKPVNKPTDSVNPTSTETNENTQKLAENKYEFPEPNTTPTTGTKESCVDIAWDPYGRIFDGVSLEPINKDEATVTLLGKDNIPVLMPGNNVRTDILGKYNILIRDNGEYKLNVVPATSHQFVSFTPNSLYKDLYESIFMPGDPAFYESADNPKRVDVALKPISTPYQRPIDIVQTDYKQVWTNGKKYIKIEIRVTHPKSLVKLIVNENVVKDNGEGEALPLITDKKGYWKVLVRDYKVLSQNGFKLEISKNPQYYMYAGQLGDTTTLELDPILPYIEGYTYNDSGSIIPNATIQIRLKMNDSVFFETTSDETGYFTILPTNLPPLDYYLVFVDPANNLSLKKTTTQFVGDNKDYYNQENINLLKGEKNGQLLFRNQGERSDSYSFDNFNPNEQAKALETAGNNKINKKLYPLIATIIVFIILLIIFVLFYFKKNLKTN